VVLMKFRGWSYIIREAPPPGKLQEIYVDLVMIRWRWIRRLWHHGMINARLEPVEECS
jgi:hypothetical protein